MSLMASAEDLDEINGDIPDHYYFPYFADIAVRARKILSGKTSGQIFECSKLISFLTSNMVEKLENDLSSRESFLGHDEKNVIPSSKRLSEVTALRMDFDERYPSMDMTLVALSFPDYLPECRGTTWHKAEHFAVLTLVKLVESIACFEITVEDFLSASEFLPTRKLQLLDSIGCMTESDIEAECRNFGVRLAGAFALEAMESINYAEKLIGEYDQEMHRLDEQSTRAEVLNTLRHEKRNIAMDKVLLDWESNQSKFRSAPKAGQYYSTWLITNNLKEYEPGTIANWIRKHAIKKGIKLR